MTFDQGGRGNWVYANRKPWKPHADGDWSWQFAMPMQPQTLTAVHEIRKSTRYMGEFVSGVYIIYLWDAATGFYEICSI